MQEVNWRLFTLDEKLKIQKLIDAGLWQNLTAIIPNSALTPEKELELQKIVTSLKPQVASFDSDVRKKWFGKEIKTPEEEAEFQSELTQEFDNWKKKQQGSKVEAVQPEAPAPAPAPAEEAVAPVAEEVVLEAPVVTEENLNK